MAMYCLVDCNNFYASCERVFNPKWKRKPIVVLSNNDGCVIARSNEAKALGIPMGAPCFQFRDLFKAHDVIVCSSNFTLYGDMSQRVMKSLAYFSSDIQIYSIDEAFLIVPEENLLAYGKEIRSKILQWTGLPVSIGMARTKTLTKVANERAKKDPSTNGVFCLDTPDAIDAALEALPVTEIWGIGKRLGARLNRLNIFTAKDFRDADDATLRKHLSVVGLRTAFELREIPCLTLEEIPAPKKSVTCSRTFGRPIDTLDDLYQAVASYTARAAEKIREQESLATLLTVFVELYPFQAENPGFFHVRITLPQPTDYTPHLIHYAKQGAAALFKAGNKYRKAGVIFDGLVDGACFQTDLFSPTQPSSEKHKRLMRAIDGINEKYGRSMVHTAAEGIEKSWKMKQQQRTARFTTAWDELLTIQI